MSSPERISAPTLDRLAKADEVLLLSVASCWEAAIKYAIGKLQFPEDPASYVPSQIKSLADAAPNRTRSRLTGRDAAQAPGPWRPFDRVIIAQALMLGLPVLTSDSRFAEYGVEVLAP